MQNVKFITSDPVSEIREMLSVYKKVFLVCGKKSFQTCGASQIINKVLTGFEVCSFSDFSVNPKISDVNVGIRLAKQFEPDIILCVGGGSVIDMGKCINALYSSEDCEYSIKQNRVNVHCPLIAIPTTAGTGSEATHFAVVYIDGKKFSLAHESMRPDCAVIVPALSAAQPLNLALTAGFDAFAQAIEAFWSCNSTVVSDKFAMDALALLFQELPRLKDCCASHDKIARGAYYAGCAINIAKTTAPHAMSYTLTSDFGIPHGQAVAFFLPCCAEYNAHITADDCNDVRGVDFVLQKMALLRDVLHIPDNTSFEHFLRSYIANAGLEIDPFKLNISSNAVSRIMQNVNLERLKNNPRRLTDNFNLTMFISS